MNTGVTGTATISSVSTSDSLMTYLGLTSTYNTNADWSVGNVYFALTNATTVTATRANGSLNITCSYEVIELVAGVLKSVQRGVTAQSGGSTTATISSVDTTKSMMTYLGTLGQGFQYLPDQADIRGAVTNATTLTFTINNASGTSSFAWQVAEYN